LGSALPWKRNLPEFLNEHKQIHRRKLNLYVLGFPEIIEGTEAISQDKTKFVCLVFSPPKYATFFSRPFWRPLPFFPAVMLSWV
jgi:hypothetical protein